MIISSIRLFNFGIYKGQQEIFPGVKEGKHGNPVTLVGGYNGRGKTSLLEAVLLVLYGNRSRVVQERKLAYSTYLESLMHQGSGEEVTQSWVEMECEIPMGDQTTSLKIRRSWQKANVRTVDRMIVWINGKPDPYIAENWEMYVEEIVPSAIAELFFFDGERISELAESDETVESLQKAIRSLLNIEIVDRLIRDLVLVIRKHQKAIKNDDVLDRVNVLREELQLAENRAEHVTQAVAALHNSIVLLNRKQNDLEAEYFRTGGNLLETREKLLQKKDQIRERLSEVKTEMLSLFAGPLPFLLVQDQLLAVMAEVSEGQEIDQARTVLPILEHQNKQLIQQLRAMELDVTIVEKIELVLHEQRGMISEKAVSDPVILISSLGVAQLEDLLTGQFESLKREAKELVERYELIEFELDQVEGQLVVEVDKERTTHLLEQLADVRKELIHKEAEKVRLERERDQLINKVEMLDNKITRMAAELGGVEESRRIIDYAVKAQDDYRAFRDMMTSRKISQLSASVFEVFDLLTHKTTLVSRIDVDPNTFRFSLWTAQGKELPKSRLSSGERQMLAVAILWGLGKVSGRKLPVIIDTPMGRLDSKHRMNFVEKYLPRASHQVIVLSTDTEIVGDYLTSLRKYIGQEYLLKYDEEQRNTEIIPGYFDLVGEVK